MCICVCIDLRLGREPCSVPAWLINGVVMAMGRNEGTKRRRPASLDPSAPPGAHTHTRAPKFSLHALHLSDRHVSHSHRVSGCLSCIVVLLLLLCFIFLFIIFCAFSSLLFSLLPLGVNISFLWKAHGAAISIPLEILATKDHFALRNSGQGLQWATKIPPLFYVPASNLMPPHNLLFFPLVIFCSQPLLPCSSSTFFCLFFHFPPPPPQSLLPSLL